MASGLTDAEVEDLRGMLHGLPRHLTPKQVADRLGVSRRAILDAIREGRLEASKPWPNRVLISERAALSFLRKYRVRP